MKKSTWIAVILKVSLIAIVLVLFPLSSQAAPLKQPNWWAEYYDNPSLSGQPRIGRWESGFGHDWGYGSPGLEIPKDHFSARWSNRVKIEQGTYLFILNVDDGVRVWLDGSLIVDAWSIGAKQEIKSRVYIDKTGEYEIQVAYFENTQPASIQMEWIQLGGAKDIVGAWHGEYFNNRNLAGVPEIRRQDGGINFNWNFGSPHPKITRDNFSIRWTRSVYLQEGLYNFKIQHDDGMKVYVDGKIIYDSWYDQSVSYVTRQVPLNGGYRTFVVEFYDHIGQAVAELQIDKDPGNYSNVDVGPDGPGITVDERHGGFSWGGPISNRFTSSNGFDGNFYWTYNSQAQPANHGKWTPPLTGAGNYEIYAYIPGNKATTGNARYEIHHYGYVDERSISQNSYRSKFVSLGTYYFNAAGNEYVILHDNTGESPRSTALAFDALKFVKR